MHEWRCKRLLYAGDRPYHCDVCGRSYRRSTDLLNHKRVHSGQKPFQCHSCEKSFRTVRQLRDHERVHSGARPFPCLLCEKTFRQPGHVTEHLRTHTGIRSPFVYIYSLICCYICIFWVCLISPVFRSYSGWGRISLKWTFWISTVCFNWSNAFPVTQSSDISTSPESRRGPTVSCGNSHSEKERTQPWGWIKWEESTPNHYIFSVYIRSIILHCSDKGNAVYYGLQLNCFISTALH